MTLQSPFGGSQGYGTTATLSTVGQIDQYGALQAPIVWKKTTLDGFGRATKVETGHDGVTEAVVESVYGACACNPLGKLKKVSLPHAPGATAIWTTYTYDGMGRTLTALAADGASTTSYVYQGRKTTVTDPKGKYKTFSTDGMGNLVQVDEPAPAGGTYTTTYTYDVLNHVVGVTMPRPNGTQTRTYVYTGNNLTSATNSETGTVTYGYNAEGQLAYRSDAKGQRTDYIYDTLGIMTQVKYNGINNPASVTLRYDGDSAFGPQAYGMGRQTGADFVAVKTFHYGYSYARGGKVTRKQMSFDGADSVKAVQYEYDELARMTKLTHPDGNVYTLGYDAMSRLETMSQQGGSQVAKVIQYGVAGQVLSMTYDAVTEGRSYNSLLQLTNIAASSGATSLMNMTYTFPAAGQNNGRIASQTDNVSGETVVFTYDSLNRLVTAAGTQTQTYTYDGFGNLTAKTGPNQFTADINPATNHPATGFDANGNAVGGLWGSWYMYERTFDVENRLTLDGPNGITSGYDPSNKRVYKATSTQQNMYFYGADGKLLATYLLIHNDNCGCDLVTAGSSNLYFGGKLIRSQGQTVVTDRLGSVRWKAGASYRYYPYGEEYTTTANGTEKFGTYTRDSNDRDYADQRYYWPGSGRFMTADPSTGVSGANPGSWNKYAYVVGDPINFRDPRGLEACPPEHEDCDWSSLPGGVGSGNDGMIVIASAVLGSGGQADPGLVNAAHGLFIISQGGFKAKPKCKELFETLIEQNDLETSVDDLMGQAAKAAGYASGSNYVFDLKHGA